MPNTDQLTRDEAIQLLGEAMARLNLPSRNANGGSIQMGGVYWRLVRVLTRYVEPNLVAHEGAMNTRHLRAAHPLPQQTGGVDA